MSVMFGDFGFRISISEKKSMDLSDSVEFGCRFVDPFGSYFVVLGGFIFSCWECFDAGKIKELQGKCIFYFCITGF